MRFQPVLQVTLQQHWPGLGEIAGQEPARQTVGGKMRTTRAERGKQEFIPAPRAHSAFSAALESRAVKSPFDHSGSGSLFHVSREYGAGGRAPS